MQRCWNCGQPGRNAAKSWDDAWAIFWCDTCQVGWGQFGGFTEMIVQHEPSPQMRQFMRDYQIGLSVNQPQALTLLTGI